MSVEDDGLCYRLSFPSLVPAPPFFHVIFMYSEAKRVVNVVAMCLKQSFGVLLQWVEESFTNFDKGINWRSYVVCDVAYNNVNNWLWTPFIERGTANRIYIEIKFTIRDCSLFPGNALSCKETFSLLYYEFDAATKEPPPWEPESYKLIGKF